MKKYCHEIKLVHVCTMHKMFNNMEIEKQLMRSYLPPVKMVLFKDKKDILYDHCYEIYKPLIPRRPWWMGNIQQCFFTHEPMCEAA